MSAAISISPSRPLYKVEKGKSVRYIKDEEELSSYLIEMGTADSTLTLGGGAVIVGEDLKRIASEALVAQAMIDRLKAKASDTVLAQLAIAGALGPDAGEKQAKAAATRLDVVADEGEDGWQGGFDDDGALVMEREVRGVAERVVLGAASFRDSADARRLHKMAAELEETYGAPAQFKRGGGDPIEIYGPAAATRCRIRRRPQRL